MIGSRMAQFVRMASKVMSRYSSSSARLSIGQDSSQGILFEVEPLTHFPEMVIRQSVGCGPFVS